MNQKAKAQHQELFAFSRFRQNGLASSVFTSSLMETGTLYRIFKEDECMGVILATGTVFLWIVVTVAAFKSMGIILKMINKGFEKIGNKFD